MIVHKWDTPDGLRPATAFGLDRREFYLFLREASGCPAVEAYEQPRRPPPSADEVRLALWGRPTAGPGPSFAPLRRKDD